MVPCLPSGLSVGFCCPPSGPLGTWYSRLLALATAALWDGCDAHVGVSHAGVHRRSVHVVRAAVFDTRSSSDGGVATPTAAAALRFSARDHASLRTRRPVPCIAMCAACLGQGHLALRLMPNPQTHALWRGMVRGGQGGFWTERGDQHATPCQPHATCHMYIQHRYKIPSKQRAHLRCVVRSININTSGTLRSAHRSRRA